MWGTRRRERTSSTGEAGIGSRRRRGSRCVPFLLLLPTIADNTSDHKPRRQAAADVPSCGCDEPAIERTTTKEGANQGRKFFTCSKGRDDGCGFFEWMDEGGGGKVVPQKRGGAPNGNVRLVSSLHLTEEGF